MNDLQRLEQTLQERLDAAVARRRESQDNLRREMEQHDRRKAQFERAAQRLADNVIGPRVLKLASLFPNAHVSKRDPSTGHGFVCSFDHTPEYPASTKVDIDVSADSSLENAIITYQLEILPIFFQFEGHDQLVVPLDSVDDERVASWLENKLVGFTDTYLQLQVINQYQQANLVVDPVCGMRINRADAQATADYEGRKYYFCVEQCREKFMKEPGRYADRRRGVKKRLPPLVSQAS
jgi:YHS domain-containing protein